MQADQGLAAVRRAKAQLRPLREPDGWPRIAGARARSRRQLWIVQCLGKFPHSCKYKTSFSVNQGGRRIDLMMHS